MSNWPRPWDLVGIKEAAAELGITRSTLDARMRRDLDFPKPITVIGAQAVYDLLDLKAHHAEFEANRGERRSQARKRAVR
jgi:predicted DNA-binding transcriptional regulator AlpA